MISCLHWTRKASHGQGACALGLYGGKPWVGNCQACMTAGENSADFAAALFARAERTHPADHRGLPDCCGPVNDLLRR